MINFDSEICTNFEEASSREWLETNGIGGFASSTISGANTRRYHGLLTAATDPPLGRVTMLSKFEEVLSIDDQIYELSANQYPDSIHPKGFQYLKTFALDPFPSWIYEIDGVEIQRKIFMVNGENTTVCQWSVLSKVGGRERELKLTLKPLLSFADYHSIQHETEDIDFRYTLTDRVITLRSREDLPELYFTHNSQKISETGYWYKNFEYEMERSRGFDFHEDLFQPFSMEFDLDSNAEVIVSTESEQPEKIPELENGEKLRRERLVEIAAADDDLTKQLVLAADQFIVSRGAGETIIAGYPWFSDWGRDTMIALPGLTLATNREGIAKNILREFSNYISRGMIPNRFPDQGNEPEYNTVDATLWYIEAIRAYVEKTGDYDFVKEHLYEKLVEIIYWHQKGTRFNIHMADDGLIFAGEEGLQLTWMDAKYGDEVFTPRIGKPVEIQALWYNALKVMSDFAKRFKDKDGKHFYEKLAKQAKKSFNDQFWNEEAECLFDVVNGETCDPSIRPNQIFAVSLKYSMLSMFRAKKVVQKVEAELFTPVGLRSLSPNDTRFCGIYTGSPYERDSAYHQGTVWAWLMGAFIESVRRTYPKGRKSRQYISKILDGFMAHLYEEGVGQISEIFDGDPPHLPRGCFAQAWSVAEILRVLK
ncbi:MAG: amylo-alpha-1,6-glucosidase [Pyrinomonadaceae bacterium]